MRNEDLTYNQALSKYETFTKGGQMCFASLEIMYEWKIKAGNKTRPFYKYHMLKNLDVNENAYFIDGW